MNPNDLQIAEIWVYLSGSPLFALILTLTAYQVGSSILLPATLEQHVCVAFFVLYPLHFIKSKLNFFGGNITNSIEL